MRIECSQLGLEFYIKSSIQTTQIKFRYEIISSKLLIPAIYRMNLKPYIFTDITTSVKRY